MIWGILLGLYAPPLKKMIALAAVIVVGGTAFNYLVLMPTNRAWASRYTGEPLEVLANMALSIPFIALGIAIGLAIRYVALKMATYFAKGRRA